MLARPYFQKIKNNRFVKCVDKLVGFYEIKKNNLDFFFLLNHLRLKLHNKRGAIPLTIEPRHEISNNVVCATSKGSDQPAHTRSLIRALLVD